MLAETYEDLARQAASLGLEPLVERALLDVLFDMLREFGEKLEGLMVHGSSARRQRLESSDLDVIALTSGNFNQFRFFRLGNGMEVDLRILSVFGVSQEWQSREFLANVLSSSLVVFDRRGLAGALLANARVEHRRDQLRAEVNPETVAWARHVPTSLVEDLRHMIQRGEPGTTICMHGIFMSLLALLYQVDGRDIPKTTRRVASACRDYPCYAQAISRYQAAATTEQFLEYLDAFAREIVANLGGPVERYTSAAEVIC